MAITFEDWSTGGVIIDDDQPYDDDVRIGGILLLDETEAVQVRDELLRRYPLEKAEAPKPAEPVPLSLEVGKWYRRRDGEVVQIVRTYQSYSHHFVSSEGFYYTDDGYLYPDKSEEDGNLIAEVPAPGEADEASKQEGHESAGAKAAAAIDAGKPAWTPPTLEESYASLQRAYEKTDAAFARKCEEHSAEREKRFELEARLNEALASHAKLEAKIRRLESALKALIGE